MYDEDRYRCMMTASSLCKIAGKRDCNELTTTPEDIRKYTKRVRDSDGSLVVCVTEEAIRKLLDRTVADEIVDDLFKQTIYENTHGTINIINEVKELEKAIEVKMNEYRDRIADVFQDDDVLYITRVDKKRVTVGIAQNAAEYMDEYKDAMGEWPIIEYVTKVVNANRVLITLLSHPDINCHCNGTITFCGHEISNVFTLDEHITVNVLIDYLHIADDIVAGEIINIDNVMYDPTIHYTPQGESAKLTVDMMRLINDYAHCGSMYRVCPAMTCSDCIFYVRIDDMSIVIPKQVTTVAVVHSSKMRSIPSITNYLNNLCSNHNITSLCIYYPTDAEVMEGLNIPNIRHFSISCDNVIPTDAYFPKLTTLIYKNAIIDFKVPKLTVLNISNSGVEVLSDFDLPLLTTLVARNNNTIVVPDFSHLPLLQVLELFNNDISELPNFSHLPNLTSLDVAGNRLDELPLFDRCPKLQFINAESNNIDEVPVYTTVKTLDLIDNNIYGMKNIYTMTNNGIKVYYD